jgi:cleavage and polyadenylation specificity factor subunit 6/7
LQWTTDKDVEEAVKAIGISDFMDVKFFENRANGQSKGFCVVSFGSEASVKAVMDRMPKREIHGQHPVALPNNKQAITQVCSAPPQAVCYEYYSNPILAAFG